MPSIVEYLETYPDVAVEAVFLDRVVNLLEEGLDVGIRIGELADSSMRALKVGTIRRVTVASPAGMCAMVSMRPLTSANVLLPTLRYSWLCWFSA